MKFFLSPAFPETKLFLKFGFNCQYEKNSLRLSFRKSNQDLSIFTVYSTYKMLGMISDKKYQEKCFT